MRYARTMREPSNQAWRDYTSFRDGLFDTLEMAILIALIGAFVWLGLKWLDKR